MALGARRQAALYYARKRRRSKLQTMRLYRTGYFPPGTVTSGVVEDANLSSPVTLHTKVDLSVTGLAFSWGSSVSLTVNASTLTLSWPNGDVTIQHPGTGEWTLALAIRPGDGTAQLANQFGILWRSNDLTVGTWANPGETLTVGNIIIANFGVYGLQLPRDYYTDGEVTAIGPAPASTGEFWINSTLLFMNGFDQPLFEGDV